MLLTLTQDYVLGYSQPSLRDCFVLPTHTQDCVLGYAQSSLRTVHAANSPHPGLRPELLSVVPSGLFMQSALTQAYVLNYSQSSLRDWLMLLTPPGE
jgi:hypothetical protein